MTKIINGLIVTPHEILEGYTLVITNGQISEIVQGSGPEGLSVIDDEGNYVAPGCIDMHVHGGDNSDFIDATPESFYKISTVHAKHGTTSMYATLFTSPREIIDKCLKICEEVMKDPKEGANILGIHIEGNYLNPNKVGSQNIQYITKPNSEEYHSIANSTTVIKRWSAAPEIEGAIEFGKYATSKGIIVSLAHTLADYEEVKKGFEQGGFVLATHFYNAMTSVHKNKEFKKEGTVEACFLIDDMDVEVISDGIHVPPAILKLIYKIKGVERTALCTDALRPAGCNDTSNLEKRFIIEDGVVKLADRSALAGSIATADIIIRTMIQKAGVPIQDALRMASETPARIMKIIDKKGILEKGKDADIIIVNENIDILYTIVGGKVVYRK